MPAKTATRQTTTRQTIRRAPVKANSESVDKLADTLASGLNISKGKGKQDVPTQTPEEQRIQAMREMNATMQGLTSLVQSGWKAGMPPSAKAKDATALVTSARGSLARLRVLRPDDLDVERAASSVVGKLLALELFREALEVLAEVRIHLLELCGHKPPTPPATLPSTSGPTSSKRAASKRSTVADYLEQLSVILPSPDSVALGTDLLTIISTYLSHVLTAFSSHIIASPAGDSVAAGDALAHFAIILHDSPTLIAWIPQFSSLSSSHLTSVLTRAYTALTKSSSRAQNYPQYVFRIRHYALLCLLYTSPSTIESSIFWDQLVKFTVAFARATPALWLNGPKCRQEELEATNLVLSVFSDILSHAEKRSDAIAFLSGKSFVAFCDYWLGFAKKAGDIVLLDRISSLMHSVQLSPSPSPAASMGPTDGKVTNPHGPASPYSTPVPSRPSSPSKAKQRSIGDKSGKMTGTTLQMAKLCASFVQVCTFIETLDSTPVSEEDYVKRLRDAVSAVGRLRSLLPEIPLEVDDEQARAQGKMERALERLRRAALKALDKSLAIDRSSKYLKALLAEIAIYLSEATKLHPNVDFYTSALDTYFTLARTSLVPSDPRTHETSFSFLSSAAMILGLELTTSHEYTGDITRPVTVEEETFANYVRCLSGAFHNLAGTLYQAEKHGTTIRFLRQSCVLGKLALRFEEGYSRARKADSNTSESTKTKREEAWKQLEEQLTRRWELLGVCYSKIADRKLACDAFVESVASYVFPTSFVQAIKTTGPSTVFDASPPLKQIGIMIDRITYMATCELLRDPAEVSFKRRFDKFPVRVEDGQVGSQKYVLGAILERQMESLEGSRWRDGVRSVISALLADLLSLYDAESWPIRRAATMLRCLEFSYYQNQDITSSIADLPLETHEFGEQIELLLCAENLGHDASLASLRSPYQAAAHLWLALHCHRIQDARQSQLVIKHVQDACHLLRPLFARSEPEKAVKSPKQATTTRKGQSRVVASRATAAAARAKAAKSQAAKVPVTPKHPRDLNTEKAQSPPNQTSILGDVAVAYESFVKLADLIRMNIHLLGLLGHVLGKVQLLRILRRLCEQYRPRAEDDYMKASIDLAHEYVKLGKTEKGGSIYNHVLASIRSGSTSDEVKALYFLRYAESLSLVEDVSNSSSIYCEALSLSESLDNDEKHMSTVDKVRARVAHLERSALASNAYATIQLSKDDPTAALAGFLQSLRLWNRAMSSLERLRPPSTPAPSSTDSPNPFDVTDLKDALPSTGSRTGSQSPEGTKLIRPQPALNGLEWRIADGLLTTLFCLTHIYGSRGSVREAEYFADQAHELATSLNAPIMICRALARTGELQLQLGEFEKGYQTLVAATESLKDVPGPDAADIRRLHAEYNRLNEKNSDARQLYAEAAAILDELNNMFSTMDGYGIRRSTVLSKDVARAKAGNEALVPSLVSSVLRQHIWLLRDEVGEEYQALLDKFLTLPPSVETKADEHTLVGKLTLHDVYDCFKEDMFLSSITESAIALPMGMSGSKSIIASSSAQDILETLQDAEKMFWSTLSAIAHRGKVSQIREVTGFLALIQSFNTSLGKAQKNTPVVVANLLDMSTALTLRREMLEVIQGKFPMASVSDDLRWPAITSNGSPISADRTRRRRRIESRSSSDIEDSDNDDNEGALDESWLQEYWASIDKKYRTQVLDAKSLAHSKVDVLPENWTVVSISITDDKSSLFVSRQRAHCAPLVFCLPLKGRRENDGDEHLAFSDAVEELKEIIRLSDEGTKQAIHVKSGDKQARAAWWADRAALDTRLKDLLENMEFCWLGGFKTILSPPVDLDTDALADLQTRLDKVFTRSLVSQSQQDKSKKVQKQRLRLDDALVACFGALSPRCKDEELEDLVYFVLDLYQFHGVQVAIAEVDVDQVVVDLRTALEEHASRAKGSRVPVEDNHTFLVLDKNVQAFPWESIPVLRGQSVSRVPSLDFLLDRVEFVQCRRKQEGREVGKVDRMDFDPRSAYYVLNPSGDLGGTEKRFAGWLESMKAVGWEGIVGTAPSEQQVLHALQRKDLLIYFGHGGAEQYVRSHKLRHLPRCAATMLWGCSSGLLRDMGEFDRTGTPYNYMLAGCPMLVANLWDVTDRDIDKFSQAVFDEIRLTPEHVRKVAALHGGEAEGTSVVEAVAKAREACKLKYLTGAAPVVYGIPFYL